MTIVGRKQNAVIRRGLLSTQSTGCRVWPVSRGYIVDLLLTMDTNLFPNGSSPVGSQQQMKQMYLQRIQPSDFDEDVVLHKSMH